MDLLNVIYSISASTSATVKDVAYRRLMVMIFIVAVRSQSVLLVVVFMPRDPLGGGDSVGSRGSLRRVCVLDTLFRQVHGDVIFSSCGHFVDAPHDARRNDMVLDATGET